MTVIAAKVYPNEIKISCDSQMSRGWHKKDTGFNGKIVEGSNFAIGFCGEAMILPLLMMFSKNHPIGLDGEKDILDWCFEFLDFSKKKTGNWKDTDVNLLLAHPSGLYLIEKWIPIKINDFCAIGSGFQHAEAAMYLGNDTETAVEVAINMAYGCGGEIKTSTISTKKEKKC